MGTRGSLRRALGVHNTGEGGGQCKGGLTGLREELNCDAVTKETSMDPQEAMDLRWPCGVVLKT